MPQVDQKNSGQKAELVTAIRHIDVRTCLLGSLFRCLFYRWHIQDIAFPNFNSTPHTEQSSADATPAMFDTDPRTGGGGGVLGRARNAASGTAANAVSVPNAEGAGGERKGRDNDDDDDEDDDDARDAAGTSFRIRPFYEELLIPGNDGRGRSATMNPTKQTTRGWLYTQFKAMQAHANVRCTHVVHAGRQHGAGQLERAGTPANQIARQLRHSPGVTDKSYTNAEALSATRAAGGHPIKGGHFFLERCISVSRSSLPTVVLPSSHFSRSTQLPL